MNFFDQPKWIFEVWQGTSVWDKPSGKTWYSNTLAFECLLHVSKGSALSPTHLRTENADEIKGKTKQLLLLLQHECFECSMNKHDVVLMLHNAVTSPVLSRATWSYTFIIFFFLFIWILCRCPSHCALFLHLLYNPSFIWQPINTPLKIVQSAISGCGLKLQQLLTCHPVILYHCSKAQSLFFLIRQIFKRSTDL